VACGSLVPRFHFPTFIAHDLHPRTYTHTHGPLFYNYTGSTPDPVPNGTPSAAAASAGGSGSVVAAAETTGLAAPESAPDSHLAAKSDTGSIAESATERSAAASAA
jgi:hypothetical protein